MFNPISKANQKTCLVVLWSSVVIVTVALAMWIFYQILNLSPTRNIGSSIDNATEAISARDFNLQILNWPAMVDINYYNKLESSGDGLDKDNDNITMLNSKRFSGSPYIINFFASWCVSCAQEAPILNQFWNSYKKQIAVIGVVIHDDPVIAAKHAKINNKEYIIAYDKTGSLAMDYGVIGVPETVFVDQYGKIVGKHVGVIKSQQIVNFIKLVSQK